MARHEVDEEPFDIDVAGGESDEDFKFSFDEDEDESEEEDEVSGASSENDDDDGALTDDDLEEYKRDADAARAAAAEARNAVATLRAEQIAKANTEREAAFKSEREKLSTRMAQVKAKLKAAFDDADADAHVQLTEELADLKGQERLLAVVEEQAKQQAASVVTAPKIHPKAQAWVSKNRWFNENAEARNAAVAYANTLEANGIGPGDEEYYKKIDTHMRRRWPEIFEGEKPEKKRKKPPPVTSGAREGNGGDSGQVRRAPTKVKLSALQVRIAKQWGIPKEKMAEEIMKQKRREEG